MRKDIGYRQKMKEEDDYPMDTFCYYISECPMGLLHYEREHLSQRIFPITPKFLKDMNKRWF